MLCHMAGLFSMLCHESLFQGSFDTFHSIHYRFNIFTIDICVDVHVQNICKTIHDLRIRTVNLMHTARLTSLLDHQRSCWGSFIYGISILVEISFWTSPAGWCRCERAHEARAHEAGHLPSKRTRCIYTTSPSSGRTSGAKSYSSRTQVHTGAAEDTPHAHVLSHTGMINTQGQSYAKALQCRIHARPSSHNFTAPGRRKTEVEFLRDASHWRLIYP
jgi:hypothetical protein